METFENQFETFLKRGYRRVSPFFVPMLIPDMAAGQVSITLGAKDLIHVRLQPVQLEQTQSVMLLKSFSVVMLMRW